MNKRYLPAIASILLIAVVSTSFMPVFAALPTRLVAQPTLTVVTIAEDDEARATGVMWMAPTQAALNNWGGGPDPTTYPVAQDLLAQFKVFVSYNGVPVTPTSVFCQFVEKDKANPLKNQQFAAENLVSVPKENPNFICKFRWGKPGVGVLDVYYIGDLLPQYIADYILVVGADLAVGRTTVFGTEIQDICLLGWPSLDLQPIQTPPWVITKPDGTQHWVFADPLGNFVSCEDLALQQQAMEGIPIAWT
jgi:hypothetical protein